MEDKCNQFKELMAVKEYVNHKFRLHNMKSTLMSSPPQHRDRFLEFSKRARERKLVLEDQKLKKSNFKIFKRLKKIDTNNIKMSRMLKFKDRQTSSSNHEFSIDSIRNPNYERKLFTPTNRNIFTPTNRNIFTPTNRNIFTPDPQNCSVLNNFLSVQDQIDGMRSDNLGRDNYNFKIHKRNRNRNRNEVKSMHNSNFPRKNKNVLVSNYLKNIKIKNSTKKDVQVVMKQLFKNFGIKNFANKNEKKVILKISAQKKRKFFASSKLNSSKLSTMVTINNTNSRNNSPEKSEERERERETSITKENKQRSPPLSHLPFLSDFEQRKLVSFKGRVRMSPVISNLNSRIIM